MSSSPSTAGVQDIFALFAAQGAGDYVGEAVSQEAHGLQAAALAAAAGAPPAAVAAALLHDVGHMLGLAAPPGTYARMGDCGIMAHEGLGAAFLAARGLPPLVCELVRRHVDAKRYLVATTPGYALSPASVVTLGYQGGPMSPAEVAEFDADPNKQTILAMRRWDEAAKVPGAAVPPLESYRAMLEQLAASGGGGGGGGAAA